MLISLGLRMVLSLSFKENWSRRVLFGRDYRGSEEFSSARADIMGRLDYSNFDIFGAYLSVSAPSSKYPCYTG